MSVIDGLESGRRDSTLRHTFSEELGTSAALKCLVRTCSPIYEANADAETNVVGQAHILGCATRADARVRRADIARCVAWGGGAAVRPVALVRCCLRGGWEGKQVEKE